MKKTCIALLLACAFCLGLASPASAATYEPTTTEIVAEEAVMPREFVRSYEDYYTIGGNYITVMEDSNFDIFNDTRVTVALTDSQGPTKCWVVLFYKDDSAVDWTSAGAEEIALGGTSKTFSIPADNTFRVLARASAGNNGNATIQVSLK